PITWCASDPDVASDAWFVQRFEVEHDGVATRATRVVRVGADGVHQRELVGWPATTPARARADGLFLPLEQPPEVALPRGRRCGALSRALRPGTSVRVDAALAAATLGWWSERRVALPTPRRVDADVRVLDFDVQPTWFFDGGGIAAVVVRPVVYATTTPA